MFFVLIFLVDIADYFRISVLFYGIFLDDMVEYFVFRLREVCEIKFAHILSL